MKAGRPVDVQRRADLLEAMTAWLAANGAVDFSLRGLAAGIGETHRTLLYHFDSKESLLLEVVQASRTRERKNLLRAAGGDEVRSPVDLLRREWKRMSSPQNEPFLKLYYDLVIAGMRQPGEEWASLLIADWTGTVSELAKRSGISDDRAEAFGTFVYGSVRGLLLDLLISGDRDRVDAAFEELAQAVGSALPVPAENSH